MWNNHKNRGTTEIIKEVGKDLLVTADPVCIKTIAYRCKVEINFVNKKIKIIVLNLVEIGRIVTTESNVAGLLANKITNTK